MGLASLAMGLWASSGMANITTFTSNTLIAKASRPALSDTPVIASSSAFAFAFQTSTFGMESNVETDFEFGGGADARSGIYNAYSCWQGATGLDMAHASMSGNIGVWPDFDVMFEQWATADLEVREDINCIVSRSGVASGDITYSTFPAGTVVVYAATVVFDSNIWKSGQVLSGTRNYSSSSRRQRFAVVVDSAVIGVIQRIDDAATASGDLTETDSGEGIAGKYFTFESSPAVPVVGTSGPKQFSGSIVFADENVLDLNGDGRFNEDDITWLEGQIPSTDSALMAVANVVTCPACLEDCECEEVVDEADVAAIADLLNYGLGSIKAGDRDGDGCVTCADAIHGSTDVVALFDDVDTSSPLYNIGLDMNGDGIQDASDKTAFYAAVNQSDFNGDGIVDDADFTKFQLYYDDVAPPYSEDYPALNTTGGDQDGDGDTDDDDFVIFMVNYNELVCPSCS